MRKRYIQHPETLELIPAEHYHAAAVRTHLVSGDLPGYQSPIDGAWVDGRKARREDLARNHCRPYEAGEKEHYLKNREREFDRMAEKVVDRALQDVIPNINIRW